MTDSIPALSGRQLIQLLKKDGWIEHRKANHGIALKKQVADRIVVTIVPDKKGPLPGGTLSGILGPKQTGIGKKGLRELIAEHGI